MSDYTLYTVDTAPTEARPTFQAMQEKRGFVSNVYAVYGGVPHALTAFAGLTAGFSEGSLDPVEREIIQLTVSVHNQCRYCVAGHTAYAEEAGLAQEDIIALRESRPLADPKLETLRRFAEKLAARRGRDSVAEYEAFLKTGYSHLQAFEVFLGVANKTLSNMTANLLQLPLDDAFVPFAWAPEKQSDTQAD